MTGGDLAGLLLFVFAGLATPGPNVVMLTASGARFGFRATLPHLLGVVFGVGAIAGVSGLGLGALLLAAPALTLALRALAAAWILWLAFSLARAARRPRAQDRGRPMTLTEAALFQAVNAKLWAVTLAAAAGFPGDGGAAEAALRLALAFSGLNLFVCLFWTAAGRLLRRLLTSDPAYRAFMSVMAALMAASAALIFL